MKLQGLFTTDKHSIISIAILTSTGGEYSHCGLLYTCNPFEFLKLKTIYSYIDWREIEQEPDGNYRFYFESISKKDERTGKTGVRGPYSFSKLLDWRRASKSRHLMLVDINCKNIEAAIPILYNATKKIRYAPYQIWRNWLALRWGKGVPFKKRSSRRWTCSEAIVLITSIIDPAYAVRVFRLGHWLFDEYSPSSCKGGGVYEMLLRETKYGAPAANLLLGL